MRDAQTDVPTHYATHGSITDPGGYADRFDGLPWDLAGLCRVVRGLVLHYTAAAVAAAALPADRLEEVRTRQVALMLARLGELDSAPLSVARPPACRLVGCCRDAATLLCAILRHQGTPARVRVGFADYLAPDLAVDHWVAEVWESGRGWVLVDAEQAGPVRALDGSAFDPCDVPRDRFLTAGRAWRASRAGEADPRRFGYDVEERGLSVVRNNLLHDLACLNKVELTPWDFWGLGLADFGRHTTEDLALLDRVAELTLAADDRWPELRALYAGDARLRVPPVVVSYTLAGERTEARIGPPMG